MSKHHLPMLGVLAAMVCAFTACSRPQRALETGAVKSVKDRKTAPAFTLKDAEGKPVSLADYKGQVVVLDFWATWCPPCRIEIPWFVEMQRKNKDRGFTVLGVSMDDGGWDKVNPFTKRLGVNYRVLMGDDATAKVYGGVDALPTTFLIDRDGRIAAVHIGLADRRDIEDGVEQLLRNSSVAGSGGAGVAVLVGAN